VCASRWTSPVERAASARVDVIAKRDFASLIADLADLRATIGVAMELAAGMMVNANVRLVEELGRGGMGSVWIADHLSLETRVAVKFISKHILGTDPSLKERFKREAQLCAKLRSIHVVQTFDHGLMEDGRPFIVMELLEGKTLTDLVEDEGPRPVRDVAVIVSQIGKVLHRAHNIGVVHRDIKPDNIFITASEDYDMIVKVLDFGIAKSAVNTGDVVTKTGAIVGSPEFMSPEQAINSKDVDKRTDLFSLGTVTYYALTGELPFDYEDTERPFWIQLASGEHIPATKRNPALSAAIDGWFVHALQPKLEDRFQTAREMADSLAAVADPNNSAALSDLSASMDENVTMPAHIAALKGHDLSDESTVRMHIPRDGGAALDPQESSTPASVRGANVSGAYVPQIRGPMTSAPTLLAGPASGSNPTLDKPPWAATQFKNPNSKWLVAAIAGVVVIIVLVATILSLSLGKS
jgi:serine/threonine protein kinase